MKSRRRVNSTVRSLFMMLSFSEIERLVEEQLTALSAEPEIASALRSYRLQGGDETDHMWRVAGFYAYEAKNKRLVLEALYLQSLDTCAIRVFREERLKILYARKSVSDVAKLTALSSTRRDFFSCI